MPYCPKCDMEFVEGVSFCSDCKGPLLSSPQEAKALQEEAEKKALEEAKNFFRDNFPESRLSEETLSETSLSEEPLSEEPSSERFLTEEDLPVEILQEIIRPKKQQRPPSTVYVKKSERYQDMKSSASAFLLIGCTALLLSVLIFTGIIPLSGMNQISFGGVLGIMGIGCLAVCGKTRKDAAKLKVQADEENQKTRELIDRFLKTHSAEELDEKLNNELNGEDDDRLEERSLKRFSLIQDYLAIENDLPEQAYIDALSEEIYSRMFEKN